MTEAKTLHRSADNALENILALRDDLGEIIMMEVVMAQTAANAMACYKTFGLDAKKVFASMHTIINTLETLMGDRHD